MSALNAVGGVGLNLCQTKRVFLLLSRDVNQSVTVCW